MVLTDRNEAGFVSYSQNDTNLAVGKEETENETMASERGASAAMRIGLR